MKTNLRKLLNLTIPRIESLNQFLSTKSLKDKTLSMLSKKKSLKSMKKKNTRMKKLRTIKLKLLKKSLKNLLEMKLEDSSPKIKLDQTAVESMRLDLSMLKSISFHVHMVQLCLLEVKLKLSQPVL